MGGRHPELFEIDETEQLAGDNIGSERMGKGYWKIQNAHRRVVVPNGEHDHDDNDRRLLVVVLFQAPALNGCSARSHYSVLVFSFTKKKFFASTDF